MRDMSKTLEEIRAAQRRGPAMVLANGTATPANVVYQTNYPDYYFRIPKREHMTQLKNKLQRILSVGLLYILPPTFYILPFFSLTMFLDSHDVS